MNKIILMGNLTRDPEIRYTQGENALAVARFSLAINRRFAKQGDTEVDYFNCTAFGKQAEFIEKYFRKGSRMLVVGCEKLMDEKAEKFLDAFNHQAPSLVIFVSIIFYMWMSFFPAKALGGSCIVVGSIILCLFFTLFWYYRSKK